MSVPKQWIRGPADELAIAEGCWFDEAAGAFVCDFLETFCRQSKGRWAGQPLALLDWQRDFLMRLYGWRAPGNTRRFRTAYLEIPKKNGKSTLLSGLGLYHLIADGEPAAECYICACDRGQASIIYDEASRMVLKSPDLRRRLEVVPSKKTVVHPESFSKLEALSADVPSKDGLNASLVIFDELHRQLTDAMYQVMKYAGLSRDQCLHADITTAGEDERGVWFERRTYSEKVNAGVIPDIAHLGVIYRADKEHDDLDDPATWRKANPSMGVTIKEEDFAREYREAKEDPAKWGNFLRLRLGIVIREAARFVDLDRWDTGNRPLRSLDGRPCYGGLDLSSTTDLTAYVLVFPDGDGTYDVLCRCWVPGESAALRERRDNVPYRAWAERGHLDLIEGDVVDYSAVEAAVLADLARYDVRKILVDPYNATQLCLGLQAQGAPVEFLRQGFLSLSSPTKELNKLVRAGKLRHAGHPALRWCAANAVVEQDAAENVKLSKKKSTERIDGMAALVNAIAAATSGDDADRGPSIYESRGMLSF